jgi:hypothetical protein
MAASSITGKLVKSSRDRPATSRNFRVRPEVKPEFGRDTTEETAGRLTGRGFHGLFGLVFFGQTVEFVVLFGFEKQLDAAYLAGDFGT